MSDTTTVEPGSAQGRPHRHGDKPRPVSKSMNFNPLHPSMELPPEELIRLLGLETKKLRKQGKASKPEKQTHKPAKRRSRHDDLMHSALDSLASHTPQPAEDTPAAEPPKPSAVERPTRPLREHRQTKRSGSRRRGSLAKPALAIGLVSGIALSAYLFWGQPAPEEMQPVKAVTPQAVKPVAVTTPRPSVTKPPPAKPQRPAVSKTPPTHSDDPAWQASVQAESRRLRAEAEKHLAERLAAPVASVAPMPENVEAGAAAAEPAVDTAAGPDQAAAIPADNLIKRSPEPDSDSIGTYEPVGEAPEPEPLEPAMPVPFAEAEPVTAGTATDTAPVVLPGDQAPAQPEEAASSPATEDEELL